jgi:UDP-glucose 4-epimerase
MKVLITGGSGFIGSHLVKKYEELGSDVSVLDNISTGNLNNLAGTSAKVTKGDIRDSKLVESLMKDSDLVLHMAAALGVDNIMTNTIESISTNVLGSQIVLESAARLGKRILIASTSEVYGKNPKQPLKETDDRVLGTPQNFRWSYSDAKAIEEAMAKSLQVTKGLEVITARFFNTVGPRQTGQYGMVVPRFVQAAIKNEDLTVYGDGSQSRVFCHVDDAVNGVVALLSNPKSLGEVFNIGGEGEISISKLAELVITMTESKSKILYKPYSDAYPQGYEDMQRRVPDTSKLRNLTGWKPVNNLEKIINDVAKSLEKL